MLTIPKFFFAFNGTASRDEGVPRKLAEAVAQLELFRFLEDMLRIVVDSELILRIIDIRVIGRHNLHQTLIHHDTHAYSAK